MFIFVQRLFEDFETVFGTLKHALLFDSANVFFHTYRWLQTLLRLKYSLVSIRLFHCFIYVNLWVEAFLSVSYLIFSQTLVWIFDLFAIDVLDLVFSTSKRTLLAPLNLNRFLLGKKRQFLGFWGFSLERLLYFIVDAFIDGISVLLEWKFLIVVDGEDYFATAYHFVFGIVKLLKVFMFQYFFNRYSFFGMVNQKFTDQINSICL